MDRVIDTEKRQWFPSGGKRKETGEGGEEAQISSCKINESWV